MTSIHSLSIRTVACVLGIVSVAFCGCVNTQWRETLHTEIPALGHRNWIVIADAAYPKQSASGIETIVTQADQIDVLKTVLDDIDTAPHVQAIVLLDAEMDRVTEEDAPGMEVYRRQLKALLKDREVRVMPHEEIIRKLDAASKIFQVLILKTDMTIPYTSVFLELDCGYWNVDQEKRLRDRIRTKE